MLVEGWNHDWFRETNRYNLRLLFFFYNKKKRKKGKKKEKEVAKNCVAYASNVLLITSGIESADSRILVVDSQLNNHETSM